ncbi:MAG: hypothetical protein M1830_005789 [Pleopsidium flavum]|nr:MAG: hypothetical protein M1830_005789 [Pleopsidium flavum]
MCIITLRLHASKQAAPRSNPPIASRLVETPSVHVNPTEPPERVTLPAQCIRQPQAKAEDLSGTTLEQRTTQPFVPTVIPQPPPPTTRAIQTGSQESRSPTRPSSIRSAIHRTGSSGSRSLKKVRFAVPPGDDSLHPSAVASSYLDSPPPVALSPVNFEMKAMGSKDKPVTEAPRHTKKEKWDIMSNVSSGIDDGEAIQQTKLRGTPHLTSADQNTRTLKNPSSTKEETQVSRHSHGWDLDSELGSAVDGIGPALPVPIKHKVHSKVSAEQPAKENWRGTKSVPSGHAAHWEGIKDVERAKENSENVWLPPYERGESAKAAATQSAPLRRFAGSAPWENGSELDSTTDDFTPAIRAPLTSYVESGRIPIILCSEIASRQAGEFDSNLGSAVDHGRARNRFRATPRGRPRNTQGMTVDSPVLQPVPTPVHRGRDQRPPIVKRGRVVESGGSGGSRGMTEPSSGVRDSSPAATPRASRKAYYDRRTGEITYEGLRDGYVYVTKPSRSRVDADGSNAGDSARSDAAREGGSRNPLFQQGEDYDSDESMNERIRSIPGAVQRFGLPKGRRGRGKD